MVLYCHVLFHVVVDLYRLYVDNLIDYVALCRGLLLSPTYCFPTVSPPLEPHNPTYCFPTNRPSCGICSCHNCSLFFFFLGFIPSLVAATVSVEENTPLCPVCRVLHLFISFMSVLLPVTFHLVSFGCFFLFYFLLRLCRFVSDMFCSSYVFSISPIVT